MHSRRLFRRTFAVAFAATFVLNTARLEAQVPLEDTSLTPATPLPDPDLVIVRERAYGAGGVDLTSWGVGTGSDEYVQSIYFRLFESLADTSSKAVAARIVFPPEITILGVISSPNALGGENDDGVLTESDAVFAIGSDPDLYSESARGFESGGAEFVCVTSPQVLVMGLSVTNGVDDFRVIVDYGDSFPADLSFSISAYDLVSLSGAAPSLGYQIGDTLNTTVVGSGDWGEAESLISIPLTANTPPMVGCDLPVTAADSVFILRDTSGDTVVDSYDTELKIPAPDLFTIETTVGTPAGMTAGPDQVLYAVGQGGGYAVIDTQGGVTNELILPSQTGTIVDLTGLEGTRNLYFARDTNGDTFVDQLDVDTQTYTGLFTIPAGQLGSPRGITDAGDGHLYVVGSGMGFVGVDPSDGSLTDIGLNPPIGQYADLCAIGMRLFLARDSGSATAIDVHDLNSDTTTYNFGAANIGTIVGITPGPDGNLHLIGLGSGAAAGYSVVDATTGVLLDENQCMDFTGVNSDIAFTEPPPQGLYCTPKLSSSGCSATIGFSGTPSLSLPSSFDVSATDVNNNKNGLLFYGFGSAAIPFQGGTLCVQPPLRRTMVQNSGGNPPPNDCSGTLTFDFNDWFQSGADPLVVACQSLYAQFWYRDPQDMSGFGIGLSDALQFELGL